MGRQHRNPNVQNQWDREDATKKDKQDFWFKVIGTIVAIAGLIIVCLNS